MSFWKGLIKLDKGGHTLRLVRNYSFRNISPDLWRIPNFFGDLISILHAEWASYNARAIVALLMSSVHSDTIAYGISQGNRDRGAVAMNFTQFCGILPPFCTK